ncbi:MAG: DUF1573 domain-containing protein [Bacteroidota bacterium]|nr:DUF1573 domain-containing protein [Bacteroidota bacterium]
MKIIFTFLFSAAFAITSIAQNKVSTNTNASGFQTSGLPKTDSTKPASQSISLKETEFDFGKIPQGKPVTHIFEFTNTGATSVSLDNVQASCGCTTPDWNKDVVAPGASSKIIVGYNAQNEGPFAKPVTITYNGNQVKQIIIKGEVWKTPVTSAPENSSVNSLKNEQ